MNYTLQAYDDALQHILRHGRPKSNRRTGIKTRSVTGLQTRYPLQDRFPLVSRRKVWPRAVFAELLWLLSGSTNNEDLKRLGANFWTPWVDPAFEQRHGYAPGSFGPVYGFQLRHFGGHYGNGIGGPKGTDRDHGTYDEYVNIYKSHSRGRWGLKSYAEFKEDRCSLYGVGGHDQLLPIVQTLKTDPTDRRIMFNLWNPMDLDRMRLPPCHFCFQVCTDDEGQVTGHLTQRSCDFPIGVPANIQFYSALTLMLAQQAGLKAVEFVHEAVDAHCYEDQIPGVEEYLTSPIVDSPTLTIRRADSILKYSVDDFTVHGYQPGPAIKIPVAV